MGYRSNRLAVAEAASRLGLGRIASAAAASGTVEVSLSSFPGTDGPTDEEWDAEFRRVASETAAAASSSPTLFRAEFSSVPSPPRLAEWLATKWAPAVLRSYDIAGIRVGARPVYASVLPPRGDDGDVAVVEIVWQGMVNFAPVTSGRMLVEVGKSGLTARRGPGDASAGFGVAAASPLPGEDILVRRLADASSQAVEKGLAMKAAVSFRGRREQFFALVRGPPPSPRTEVRGFRSVIVLYLFFMMGAHLKRARAFFVTCVFQPSTKKADAAAASSKKPLTTVVVTPAVDVVSPVAVPSLTYDGVPASSESSGPRNAGARRSSERTRGSRKPSSPTESESESESGGE